ncbi:glycosyltransferase family 4 protein [Chitinophaga varians]|uniref:glycosyltransferase family 4 protein n=1 Tax=Chitinophaga varians TaxID=2202339 RepID=UPI00165FC918|nr:glycosyltransferase family 1 protein [Chitinophaga varians]MBC9911122.1 glycosyltransferase family 4 protein [Chitinophaga varians]
MKVYFDHQIFSMQRYGGISRYFANIYNSLKDHGHTDCKLLVLYSKNAYIQDQKFPLSPFLGERLLKKQHKLDRWNKRYSKYMIKKNDFDLLHPTYYNPYFLNKLKKPFVLTVHDMIHELFPEFFSPHDHFVPFKRATITRADHIIAISESTKRDLQHIFNIPEEKISVVYHGYQEGGAVQADFTPPFKDYVLYVGDRPGYKNFGRMVQAVKPLLERYDINLICAGGGGFGQAEQEMLIRAGIQNRTKQISASEGELNALYQKATVFVYPSLYEGFGLPILEAFKNNCPVVMSNTSCLPEVGGEAVSYFDPYHIDDMTRAIDSVLNSSDKANQLRASGIQQLSRFPMDKCMRETLEVYKKLI